MITTADLLDICSLYYTQSAALVRLVSVGEREYKRTKMHCFRCFMYALSARLILEGVY